MTELDEMYSVQTSTALGNDEVKMDEQSVVTPKTEETTTETKPLEESNTTDQENENQTVKKQSIFDNFQKPEDSKNQTTSEKQNPNEQATVKNDSDELALTKAELEAIKNHPAVKLLIGEKDLTKIDLQSLFKEAAGTDYSLLSDEMLLEQTLKANPTFSKLTKEEADAELEKQTIEFKDLSRFQQLTKREEMIASLSKNNGDNNLLKTLSELQEAQKKQIDPEEYYKQKTSEDFEAGLSELMSFVDETGKGIIGQQYKGYTATEEDVKAIRDMYDKNAKEFDRERSYMEYFKAATYDKAVEEAERRGYERAFKERANPSKNSTGEVVISPKDTASGMKDAPKEDFFNQANQ